MTMQRWCVWVCLCVLLGGCRGGHEALPQHPAGNRHHAQHSVTVTRHLSPFVNVNIDIKRPIHVRLHTGAGRPQVILKGDADSLAPIQTKVNHHTLYVTLDNAQSDAQKTRYGVVTIDIYMQTIHQFIFQGNARIVGDHLTSQNLELSLNNAGTTRLNGQMNLRKLNIAGMGYTEINGIKSAHLQVHLEGSPKVQLTGVANISEMVVLGSPKISFYWLKSPVFKLRARGEGGVIQIGGVADKLDVELSGGIRFDGRYIRAKDTFVRTRGHSIAYISTALHQHTLAMDASDIYYYNLPVTNSNFMAKNGAVLDMRSWELMLEQGFSEYNESS